MEVPELTVKPSAGREPKDTALTPVKPLPVRATVVPPPDGPALGEVAVIWGTGL
jgi:hypothetical protein